MNATTTTGSQPTRPSPKGDKPNFAAWSLENLANFASDAYDRMRIQAEIIEQQRMDLKDAMAQLRKHVDDWK